jgi:hypothetical protein
VNTFDVTAAVTAWLADPSTNRGWVILSQTTDGVDIKASESAQPPELRLFCD